MSYVSYIASHRWRTNGARVRELAVAQGKCRLCASEEPLEVHHRDYKNLGNELDGDLVALCGWCHRDTTCRLRGRSYALLSPLCADVGNMRDIRAAHFAPACAEVA